MRRRSTYPCSTHIFVLIFDGNAKIAGLDNGRPDIDGLDIAGLDIDGRMCRQLAELKLQNFIP